MLDPYPLFLLQRTISDLRQLADNCTEAFAVSTCYASVSGPRVYRILFGALGSGSGEPALSIAVQQSPARQLLGARAGGPSPARLPGFGSVLAAAGAPRWACHTSPPKKLSWAKFLS